MGKRNTSGEKEKKREKGERRVVGINREEKQRSRKR